MTPERRRRVRAFVLIGVLIFSSAAFAGTPEPVRFGAGDGTRLSGLLFRPSGDGPHPGAVIMHGCSGMLTKSGNLKKRERQWAELLVDEGYVVLLADSFTARGFTGICRIKDRPILPQRERPGDAYGALVWLQARPFVRPDKVALLGWSNGAMAMLWTVRDAQEARPRGLSHDFAAAVGFYPGCVELRREAPDYRAKIPVLIQMGEADNWTLPKPCRALVEEANGRGSARMEIDIYAGAFHNFDHPSSKVKEIVTRNSQLSDGEKRVMTGTNPDAREKAIRRVLDWLGPRLKGSL